MALALNISTLFMPRRIKSTFNLVIDWLYLASLGEQSLCSFNPVSEQLIPESGVTLADSPMSPCAYRTLCL